MKSARAIAAAIAVSVAVGSRQAPLTQAVIRAVTGRGRKRAYDDDVTVRVVCLRNFAIWIAPLLAERGASS